MTGGTRSYEMARRLVSAGHEVHMVTSWREDPSDKDWFKTDECGIRVHWLPVAYSNHMSFTQRIKAFFKFAFRAAKKASEIKADIIFATSTPLTIAIPAAYAAKRQKIPMVFEVRDLWPELPIAMGALTNPITKFLAKRLELYAYKNASSVVALSPGMKKGVVQTGYTPSNVAVIPNSADIEMFEVESKLGQVFREQREWLGDKPLLIYTGTFGLINGVGYMVDLAASLKKLNSNVRILVIGNGYEFDTVKARAEKLDVLNSNFFMESQLPKKEIPSALSAATMCSSLFIDKPEMRANSANKFFDSLAAGKPVMINYGGWMHDMIQIHNCGLSIWQDPLDKAAKEINSKLNDDNWLRLASHEAKKLAREKFDRDLLAEQLHLVLKKTAAGKSHEIESIAPGNY